MTERLFSASETARLIQTSPKQLRAWLRRNPAWNPPREDGRYWFTRAEVKSLMKAYKK